MKFDDFKIKAHNIHKNDNDEPLYAYSCNEETLKYTTKINILCKKHNIEFTQIYSKHLSGQGCSKCGREKTTEKQRWTKNKFIEESNKIHNNKFGYENVEYINYSTQVSITCYTHGVFQQRPSDHLNGKVCSKCAGNYKPTFNEFVEKATLVHGNTFKYYNQEYINSHTKIKIICNQHGEFSQTPTDHLSGYGCIDCAGVRKKTHDAFCLEANTFHNNKYKYISNYKNNNTHINILCPIHNERPFQQLPKVHLNGSGCPKCSYDTTGQKLQMTTEIFVKRANKIHNDKYLYENVVMNGVYNRVNIICKQHGEFLQKPTDHLSGCGCPKCGKTNYSKQSILYLNFIELLNNITIKHAENGNEYIINGTKLKADGYCKETNTIYEYHGDFWHGNPQVFDLSKINKVNGKTFGYLYQKTLEREQLIRDMGFNLVVIWESDWNKINNSIRTLQRLFRSSKRQ